MHPFFALLVFGLPFMVFVGCYVAGPYMPYNNYQPPE